MKEYVEQASVVVLMSENLEDIFGNGVLDREYLKGVNDDKVPRNQFVSLLRDILNSSFTGFDQIQYKSASPTIFRSNREFWAAIFEGKKREGQKVSLPTYCITEWAPMSPGRFHTAEAHKSRANANKYWVDTEYLYLGKEAMVIGGVGCIRLRSRIDGGKRWYLFSASSNGNVHEGIPLLIGEDQISKVLEIVSDCGGLVANIVRTIRVMPPTVKLIEVDSQKGDVQDSYVAVSKYCVEVNSIKILRNVRKHELLCTVAIMFPTDSYRYANDRTQDFVADEGYSNRFFKAWSFCSFDPFSGEQGLSHASRWLQDYANRNSHFSTETPILSEFDEHVKRFRNIIEFPLEELSVGQLNIKQLEKYSKYYGFEIKTQTNNITNMNSTYNIHGHGNIIDNKAKVTANINVVSDQQLEKREASLASIKDDVNNLLPQLTSEKQEHVKQLLLLLETAANPESLNRAWYDVSGKGLVEASRDIAAISSSLGKSIKELAAALWPIS